MSKKNSKAGSLLGNEATGGEIAEHGYSFQEGMFLTRIPFWLAKSGFVQAIREALGDAEAKFFVHGRGHSLEFNEYKDHQLTPSEFWPEIDHFFELEEAHPGSYWRYRLVCTGVNKDLQAICRALDRARRALPFYDGVSSIQDRTFDELARRVIEGSRQDRKYAAFVFKKVDVDFDAPARLDLVVASFRDSLERNLPESKILTGTQINAARTALGSLVKTRVAQPLYRSELVDALRTALPGVKLPTLDRTLLFTATEPASPWEERSELVLDWEQFSGRDSRSFPDVGQWRDELEELIRTRDWMLTSGAPRRILLKGTRRLSAALALGSVFSATAGFNIEVENRGKLLSTDRHADSETPEYKWNVEQGESTQSDEIAVVISVKREIVRDVRSFLVDSWPLLLNLQSRDAMVSADHINLAVEIAKRQISSVISNTGAKVVHLFLAVPGPFAIFLGHRLNATCTFQCYEHTGGATYTPTVRIVCT